MISLSDYNVYRFESASGSLIETVEAVNIQAALAIFVRRYGFESWTECAKCCRIRRIHFDKFTGNVTIGFGNDTIRSKTD